MDFKRIQVLLLAFFLIFDLYLLFILYNRVSGAEPDKAVMQYTIEEELKNRGVVFDDIAEEATSLPLVKADNSTYLADHIEQLANQEVEIDENNRVKATFIEPIDLGLNFNNQTARLSDDQVKKLEQNFFADETYFVAGNQYKFSRYSLLERAIYMQMTAYEDHKIVDGTAEIKLMLNEDYQAVSYTQTYQDQLKLLDTNTQTISERDAFQIIDGRVETFIPDNSRIDYSRLSYYRIDKLKDFSVFSPVWEIMYTQPDGTVRTVYIEAKRGTILGPR